MIIELNNIKSKIIIESTDPRGLFKSIREYMRVFAPGYYHSPKYKKGIWDGYSYLVTEVGYFPSGLLPVVHKFCSKVTNCEIKDLRKNLIVLPTELDYTLGDITLRPYQSEILEKIFSKKYSLRDWNRGVIDAATNAGKDYIMASVCKNVNNVTIILVHNADIYRKAVKFFSKFMEVGQVKSGTIDFKKVTICMQKTLLNACKKDINVKKYLKQVKCVMVDEAHRATAKDYSTLMTYIDAPIRLAFSGTPMAFEEDTRKLKIVGLFSKSLASITNEFLIKNGYSQRPIIKVHAISPILTQPLDFREDYEENLMYNINRTDKIIELAKTRQDKQILITFNEILHGEFILAKLIMSDLDVVIDMVSGEDKFREEKLQRFHDKKINILIASMIVKEGLNIPCINVIMMAQGGKSEITVKQITGRGLRQDGENDDFELIEFYDNSKYLKEHSKKRIKIYEQEKFDIQYQYECNKLGVPI